MNHEPSNHGQRRWNPALNLIWALPLSLIASYFLLFMASLNWCGVSGCSGGGFGPISDPDVPAAVSFLIASGVVAVLPLALIPWTRERWTRLLVAALSAVMVCYVGYSIIGP